uniref:Tctex1 domain containing 1 n=1 Tax=Amazona collaria TaxID=241587 RepID=A0A8B9IV71_9PSIT
MGTHKTHRGCGALHGLQAQKVPGDAGGCGHPEPGAEAANMAAAGLCGTAEGSAAPRPPGAVFRPPRSRHSDSLRTLSGMPGGAAGSDVFLQETELNLSACPLGPPRRFPVAAVDAILRDVLGSCLREQPYEPVRCREMVKDIAEVIKARVKDLVIPRYKIVVVTHIGQLNEPSIQIGSRCLWDPASDTFSSYVFKNASLFALANVYAVYFE